MKRIAMILTLLAAMSLGSVNTASAQYYGWRGARPYYGRGYYRPYRPYRAYYGAPYYGGYGPRYYGGYVAPYYGGVGVGVGGVYGPGVGVYYW